MTERLNKNKIDKIFSLENKIEQNKSNFHNFEKLHDRETN